MAIARLPVILVLVISILQFSQEQQCGLSSNANLGLGKNLGLESLIGVITPTKPNSPGCKCGNNGCNSNTKAALNSLRFHNLQQSHQPGILNLQPIPMNLQSALGGLHQQQQLNNQQQNLPQQLTSEQAATLQFINQQPAVLQSSNQIQQQGQLQSSCDPTKQSQNLQDSLNLQLINLGKLIQQPVSQSSKSVCLNNLQAISQQTPIQQDINVEFLPMINGQAQGLPTQVSQGTLLSNLGLTSNLPSIVSSSSKKSSSNQMVSSQNNAVPNTDAPAGVSQTLNGSPLSLTNSYKPDDRAPNKPTQILLSPLSFQSYNEQKPQTSDLPLISLLNQKPQNLVNLKSQVPIQVQQKSQVQQPVQASIQTYPLQNQNIQTCTVQNQDIPLQLVQQQVTPINQQQPQLKSPQSNCISSQSTAIMSDPVPSIQCKEQPTSDINQQMQISFDGQSNPLVSLLLSQLQSSNYLPKDSSNQASKLSGMKSLLPFLFNLLKDNNGGCCCPNCNCGYMNNGQDRQEFKPFMNNPFMQSYSNSPSNIAERTEKQEESTTNTYIIYNNTPYKADNGKQNEPKSQITEGYANQIKYGQPVQKDISQNVIESEERGPSKTVQDKKKTPAKEDQYKNSKKVQDESTEYENDDDYGYSYENED